jgi:hypothetical protein
VLFPIDEKHAVPVDFLFLVNRCFSLPTLYCADDFSRLQTPGADGDAANRSVDVGTYFLNIGEPPPFAYPVGVADLIARMRFFAANFASSCHRWHLLAVPNARVSLCGYRLSDE